MLEIPRTLALQVDFDQNSLESLLEAEIPHCVDRPLEYATFITSLVRCATAALTTDAENTHDAARAQRDRLVRITLARAEHLADARVALGPSGWTLLMGTWAAAAMLMLLAPDEPVRERTSDVLARNHVLTTAGGVADVPDMSLSELQLALDVLRERLVTSLDGTDDVLVRYIRALETRAAQFLVRAVVDKDEYDVPQWSTTLPDGGQALSSGGVASLAWYLTLAKRHVMVYMRMSRLEFYSTALRAGYAHRAVRAERDVAALDRFFDKYAPSLDAIDHEEMFGSLARTHLVAPGDLEAHAYIHGMCGIEEATVRDVVSARRSPDAVSFIATRRFRRPVVEWWRALCDARRTNARVGEEYHVQQLIVLYMVNTLVVAQEHVPWAHWFVVSSAGATHCALATFESRVRRAIVTGLPFIVQRLGRYACIVPQVPEDASRRDIERAHVAVAIDVDEHEVGTVLYDTADIIEALAVWARFMLDGWQGRVHHAPNVRLEPVLRAMLA